MSDVTIPCTHAKNMNNYKLNYSRFGTHMIIGSLLKGEETILDVGCNDGYLKKVHPNGIFTGIDYSNECVQKAKKNGYKDIKTCDLNSFSKINLKEKFDVIIFADVLEHLLHPEKVLMYFVKKNLNKKGKVIISLPNVANFTTRLNLLLGNFDYTNAGILDKTHLHLYTKSSAKKLLEGSGLKIISEKYSSNNFGFIIKALPFLGGLLGYNLIFVCKKK